MECYKLVDSEGCNWTICKENSNKNISTSDKSEDCQKIKNMEIKHNGEIYKMANSYGHYGMVYKEGLSE